MPGTIPSSDALREASPDSIRDLLNRDPEGYQKQDLSAIVVHFREMREKWKAAEAAGVRVKQPRTTGRESLSESTRKIEGQSLDELGL